MAKPKKISGKANTVYFGLGAVVVGVLCTVLLGSKPQAVQTIQAATNKSTTVSILVPAETVKRGAALSDVSFTTVDWPKDKMLSDFVTDRSVLNTLRATSALPKMLPVSKMSVTKDVGEGNAVVGKIPAGMRAISVRVDAESAVEGWASSGNYVDVIVIKSSSMTHDGLEAKVIAENVQILSAGRSTEGINGGFSAPSTPGTVTLLTTQEAALRIKTAQQIGKLTFALRGASDSLPTVAQTLSQEDFLYKNLDESSKDDRYLGTAVGPNGKKFGLHESYGWVQLQ